ncbi:MAG TPA: hypothetical protein VER55_06130 [Ardenticatenaceae bacterium]|nr:hypothetical protein [Ardenticatenaceae bacterium]
MTETPWRADIHAILPHPEHPRALLLQGTGGWALPHATPEHGIWQASLGTVNEAMGALLDLPVTTLRYVEYEPDWERRHVEAVFVLEPPPLRWEPPAGGTWAGYESPERLLEAWTLAKPLCALHHAVSYRHIVATLEEHTKLEPFSAGYYWLRRILDRGFQPPIILAERE